MGNRAAVNLTFVAVVAKDIFNWEIWRSRPRGMAFPLRAIEAPRKRVKATISPCAVCHSGTVLQRVLSGLLPAVPPSLCPLLPSLWGLLQTAEEDALCRGHSVKHRVTAHSFTFRTSKSFFMCHNTKLEKALPAWREYLVCGSASSPVSA